MIGGFLAGAAMRVEWEEGAGCLPARGVPGMRTYFEVEVRLCGVVYIGRECVLLVSVKHAQHVTILKQSTRSCHGATCHTHGHTVPPASRSAVSSVQCDQCWVLHTWFNIKYPSPAPGNTFFIVPRYPSGVLY